MFQVVGMTNRNTIQTNVFTIGLMNAKKNGTKWLQILDEMKKVYFEESQKTQDLSPLTKSPIEIKDVHIEFDDLHNNDIQHGKLLYII